MKFATIFTAVKDVAIIILLLLFLWEWNKNSGKGSSKSDTTIVHRIDSTVFHQATEIGSRPGAIPVSVPVYITIPPQNGQPGRIDTVYKKLDSLEIVKAFYTSHYYTDTNRFEFQGIKANIVVKNKVYANGLDSQQVIPEFFIPEVTKTVNKGQVYAGFDLLGPNNFGIGGNLAYKTKGDKIYQVGVMKLQGVPLIYQGGFKILITFKKK
jgi:hypothetical protein